MTDLIKGLYLDIVRKKKNVSLEVFKRFLSMKYKITMDPSLIKKRIYD